MKKIIISGLLLASTCSVVNASDITLSKSIKSSLRSKIERDLNLIETIDFNTKPNDQTLKVLGLKTLDGQSTTNWLNKRVKYIISENAFSFFNLKIRHILFLDQDGVDYPKANVKPYSTSESFQKDLFENNPGYNSEKSFTVMSNIGAALYMGGKKAKQVYGIKIPRGFLKKAEKVLVRSPRAGIIQIGEGLFAPELTINTKNLDAFANSIFRLGTFFHEARHSDGNGESLGFAHTLCPVGHDYAGQPACDENLNGPYMVGALMMAEMTKTCDSNCSDKEKEMLKLMVVDSLNRVQKTTHKGEVSKDWDASPESI